MFIVDRDLLGKGRASKKSWTGSQRSRTLYGINVSPNDQGASGPGVKVDPTTNPSKEGPRRRRGRPRSARLVKNANDTNVNTHFQWRVKSRLPLVPALTNDIDEDVVLLDSCLELLREHPTVWQDCISQTYLSQDNASSRALSSLVDRSSQLALASATLVTFRARHFPKHLCYKYNNIAMAVLYKYISTNQYDYNAILKAICNLGLAAALQSDRSSVVTHLLAAKSLMAKTETHFALDKQTSMLFAYSDLYHAAETASTPILKDVAIVAEKLPLHDPHLLDPEVLTRAATIRKSIDNSSLPQGTVQAVHRLTDVAVAIVRVLTSSERPAAELHAITLNIASTLTLTTIGSKPTAPNRSSATSESIADNRAETEMSVILIFWCQLLMCCVVEATSSVSTENNILPMKNSSAIYNTSTHVKEGIKRWNHEAELARAGCPSTVAGDWLSLFEIVASMEVEQPTALAPLVAHVFHARASSEQHYKRSRERCVFGNWIFFHSP